MSAEELSKLSIRDTMVTTRAAARAARLDVPQTSQESTTSSPISPTPSLIESANGHVYDVSAFDEDLRRRAKIGLVKDDNNIRMRFCRESEDESRYFFHLDDDITVKLEGERIPKCSCGATQEGKACKHIFWILGQLSSVLPKEQTIQLAEDGSSVKDKHPADVIQRVTLANFAERLNWIVEDEEVPEGDELVDEVANILSVFEPTGALPAEFKSEDSQELSESSRKYRDIRALIVDHSLKYPAFFLQLQEIISPDFQVRIFFQKIDKRIKHTFTALDEYIKTGPTNERLEGLDIVNCAQRLNALVQAVEEYRDESLHSDAGERRSDTQIEMLAASALVQMLDEVTRRNYDAYAHRDWGSSNPRENNLFLCLIGPASEDQGFFVLDSLSDLANDVIRNHVVELHDIEVRLRNSPLTPPAYLNAFRTFVTEKRKRPASQSGGSSAKRTMQ